MIMFWYWSQILIWDCWRFVAALWKIISVVNRIIDGRPLSNQHLICGNCYLLTLIVLIVSSVMRPILGWCHCLFITNLWSCRFGLRGVFCNFVTCRAIMRITARMFFPILSSGTLLVWVFCISIVIFFQQCLYLLMIWIAFVLMFWWIALFFVMALLFIMSIVYFCCRH